MLALLLALFYFTLSFCLLYLVLLHRLSAISIAPIHPSTHAHAHRAAHPRRSSPRYRRRRHRRRRRRRRFRLELTDTHSRTHSRGSEECDRLSKDQGREADCFPSFARPGAPIIICQQTHRTRRVTDTLTPRTQRTHTPVTYPFIHSAYSRSLILFFSLCIPSMGSAASRTRTLQKNIPKSGTSNKYSD